MNGHMQDSFYEPAVSRSPGSQRLPQQQQQQQQQGLHRQHSRQFDAYGQMPNPSSFVPEEHHGPRYDGGAARLDRYAAAGLAGPPAYAYDMNGPQTWNPNAFSNASALGAFGATGRLRTTGATTRGRGPLPMVSSQFFRPSLLARQAAAAATTAAHAPQTWMDASANPIGGMGGYGAMPPPPPTMLGGHGGHGGHVAGPGPLRSESFSGEADDELIPTAIVIKNIPFAVKKEQLVDLMTQMNLPLPYAFNYHFDNGVFRGLAFANFTSAEETAAVIEHLNHFDLQNRKLRVEYKKMLPIQERERIEREKRERRGQLEEQHRPLGPGGGGGVAGAHNLQTQHSMSSIGSHMAATAAASPSPVAGRNGGGGGGGSYAPSLAGLSPDGAGGLGGAPEINLNDPQTLQFYSQLLLFKDDHSREALIFPASLTPQQRRVVHTLAHNMQLSHVSRGNGEQRQVHVVHAIVNGAPAPAAGFVGNGGSPPMGQQQQQQQQQQAQQAQQHPPPPGPPGPPGSNFSDPSRRALARASNADFHDARGSDPGAYHAPLRGQGSAGLLGVPDSPSNNGSASAAAQHAHAQHRAQNAQAQAQAQAQAAAAAAAQNQQNLRGARSFADLRSFTPSPVPSSASFPVALQSNIARFQQGAGVGAGASTHDPSVTGSVASTATPTLTPTASGTGLGGGVAGGAGFAAPREDSTSHTLSDRGVGTAGAGAGGLLVNGLGGLSIGSSIAPPGSTGGLGGSNSSHSPRRLRGMFSWDESGPSGGGLHAGPIGGHRGSGSAFGFEDRTASLRQQASRGPSAAAVDRTPGAGFVSRASPRGAGQSGHHQGRGSDELRQAGQQPQPASSGGVEIIVE